MVLECLYPGGIAIRTEPRIDAARTGAVVEPGERFAAAEVSQSPEDFQQFVRLGDGRGWAITRHVVDGSPITREVPWLQSVPPSASMYASYEPSGVITPPTPPPQPAQAPQRAAPRPQGAHGPAGAAQHLGAPGLPASDDAAVAALEAENARLRRALALEAENAGLRANLSAGSGVER